MFIINNKKIFVSISAFLVLASIGLVSYFGLPLGIDFKGGALLEVNYTAPRPEAEAISNAILPLEIGAIVVQPTGDTGYFIKTQGITDAEKNSILKAISFDGKNVVEEKTFTSIGPSVGKELARKALVSMLLVALGIILFIAYSFRKVSKPISSWRYGIIAIVTLLHDIIIPVGVFSAIAHFTGAEVDTLFVVAILTILGLSVSDTIVVFDRIRENLKNQTYKTFSETVGKSLEQAFVRSINTSLTVILALLALVFFGPESTRTFALMLTAGMFFGTYSSIFLASPMLVLTEDMQKGGK